MIKIGQFNHLTVVSEVPFGVYLDGLDWGEILLPKKFVPANASVGDELRVFIYFDSEDQIIATTQRPRANLNQVAFLKVVDVNRIGAFLDWGLDKDLLVPVPEQYRPMEMGQSYLVYLKLDAGSRIVASSKIDRFLDKEPASYKQGQEVSVVIANTTDLGTKVIINDQHWGLIHHKDIFTNLRYGKRMTAYIQSVRHDGKINVMLNKTGNDNISGLAEQILNALNQSGGFLPLHDKSDASVIKRQFSVSKRSFKSAIGHLYKQKKISLEPAGIRLIEED